MGAQREHEFPGDTKSPAAARRFASAVIGELVAPPLPPHLCDDVELIVSELVTNAVRAGSPSVIVSIDVADTRVMVRVADEADGWPAARLAGIHDISGRGLPLVSAISAAWGVRQADTGKVVWAEVTIDAG